MPTKTSVLIVGAGPVGLAMAIELARYGVSVRIVDKAAQRTDKSKALVLWSRTLEMLDRAGASAALIAAGRKVTAANLLDHDKLIARITLDCVETPHPYALMLPQSETERFLAEHLSSLGVEVERSLELTRLSSAADGVAAILTNAQGREELVETSWLVGCDGAHSAVRHQLVMEFRGSTLPTQWMLADLHLEGVPRPDEILVGWHCDGMLAIFPMEDGRYRVIADAGEAHAGEPNRDPSLEEVQELLNRRGPAGIRASNPIWLSSFRINERMISHYREGRVFLAGDAAHVHSPAGGQGMNTGIQDACNLAWKLAMVCRGTSHCDALLDSYSIERAAVGRRVLAETGRVTSIGLLKGEFMQLLRNRAASLALGLSTTQKLVGRVITEISIGYPQSPLNGHGIHIGVGPGQGERAPIRTIEPPVGAGDTPRFALFAGRSDDAAELLRRFPRLLESDLRPPFARGGLWLVRPDGYVALATAVGGTAEAGRYLARFSDCS